MDKKKRYRVLVVALLSLARAPAWSRAEITDRTHVLAEFTIDSRAEAIAIPVIVDGARRDFLLDTGSTLSVFDRSLASGTVLGELPVSPTVGPPIEKRLYAAPEAFVGGLDMRPSGPVLYSDLSSLRAVADRSIWGVIGMRFLTRFIVQLDLGDDKVRFIDPRTRPRADWGVAVPMGIDQRGIPIVKAQIAGAGPEDLEIDTGDNSGGNLRRVLFRRIFPRTHGPQSTNLIFTGMESSPMGRLPELAIGGISFHGIIFESANISSLGLAFARRSVITFDFPRGIMHLKAGRRLDVEEDADMSGLHLLRRDGRIMALAIDPASPADRSGMRKGDVILGEAGQLEAPGDIVALRRLLCSGDGTKVELTILRDGKTIPVEFRLRKVL